MFSSGVNSAQDGGAGDGDCLIPVRLVWRYGGRNVSLTGTFTRWSEHIRMSPVEGFPDVLEAICSVTPGWHQYKFYVDGEWRHDERQLVASGDYGIVNIVQACDPLAWDPKDYEPPTTKRKIDVGDVSFQHRVTLSDIEAFRNHVSIILSTHPAHSLMPESGKVVALDVSLPVMQAFHVLYEQGTSVAPLWDSDNGEFVGMLSAMDFILILREIRNHGFNLTEEEFEAQTISSWKGRKQQLKKQVVGNEGQFARALIHASPYDSLKDVTQRILENEVATVPILHTSAEDGSFPQLLHLASLSEILECICRQFGHSSSSLKIFQQPIGMLPLGTWVPKFGQSNGRLPLAMLTPNASLRAALSLLVQAGVSSIVLTDHNDSLVDVYSRSDIIALAKDKAYAQIHLDEISVYQALHLGQDVSSPFGLFNRQRCQMCLRSDSLIEVMERLSHPGVRRLVVVESGSKRVEGIISLTDVFKFLIG